MSTVTDKEILRTWNENKSIKAVSKSLNISYQKVLKSLSSNGIIINNTHQKIMDYYNQGKSIQEISEIMKMNIKVIQSYLPRVRPIYNVNQSQNALRIQKFRQKS